MAEITVKHKNNKNIRRQEKATATEKPEETRKAIRRITGNGIKKAGTKKGRKQEEKKKNGKTVKEKKTEK